MGRPLPLLHFLRSGDKQRGTNDVKCFVSSLFFDGWVLTILYTAKFQYVVDWLPFVPVVDISVVLGVEGVSSLPARVTTISFPLY